MPRPARFISLLLGLALTQAVLLALYAALFGVAGVDLTQVVHGVGEHPLLALLMLSMHLIFTAAVGSALHVAMRTEDAHLTITDEDEMIVRLRRTGSI